jgi:release factor glutamine methyltransferase
MTVYFQDLRIETSESVYEPAEDSFLLAENLEVCDGDTVLDVGTGTGIIALTAAGKAGKVLGVDLNPEAVKLAKINAGLNGIVNTEFIESDLFSNVSGVYDLIAFNPPYLPVDEDGQIGRAWSGGVNGNEVIESFINTVGDYLKPAGRVQLLASSLNDVNHVLHLFMEGGFNAEITARNKFFFEELYVLTARH